MREEDEREDRRRWGRYRSDVRGFPDDMESNAELVLEEMDRQRQSFHSVQHRNLFGGFKMSERARKLRLTVELLPSIPKMTG